MAQILPIKPISYDTYNLAKGLALVEAFNQAVPLHKPSNDAEAL